MKIEKWLTISSLGSARITAKKPDLKWNEISMKLDISLPDSLFQKPYLEASITIPEEAAVPSLITSEVVENVKEAINMSTELELNVSVIPKNGKEEKIDYPI